jgi:hypothetical protein
VKRKDQQGRSKEAQRALDALGKCGMETRWAPGRAEALEIALSCIMPRDTVGVGGSVTLDEIGLTNALRGGKLHGGSVTFLDQYRSGLSREEALSLRRKSLDSDIFFSGANAITMSGEIVNMDGYGNRVAALAFGPRRICIVAGINKLVADFTAALARIGEKAAPLNCRRLNRRTPCAATGQCDDRNCAAPERICNILSVIRRQPGGNRIKVILVGEELGY